jgi:hypothetical protein
LEAAEDALLAADAAFEADALLAADAALAAALEADLAADAALDAAADADLAADLRALIERALIEERWLRRVLAILYIYLIEKKIF